jgi:hypothetical protein
VVVLVRPDNGRTRTLCLAVRVGAPVVNYDVSRCRRESSVSSRWWSRAPFFSADYLRTCY